MASLTITGTKADIGLGNADNTSDADKPVSTAQATAIGVVQTDIDTHELRTDNPHNITKTQVGLGNVPNLSFSGTNTGDETATTIAAINHAAAAKTNLVDADEITGQDSASSFSLIRTTWTNVKAFIKTYFDTLYTAKLITTNRQTDSYTLVLTDADKLVEMNKATANNLTVPLNSSVAFPTGTQLLISQYGAGQTTVVATGGVTIRSSGGKLKLAAQYAGATLIKIATDEWYLFGDITT